MRTEVDKYRGWEISFDTETEKFTAYSNLHDLEIEKGSYASVKKRIDEFVKENDTFKPYYIVPTPDHRMYFGKDKIKIIGCRKDGVFVYEDNKGKKYQLSKYHEKHYMLYHPDNEAVLAHYDEMIAAAEDIRKEANKYLQEKCKIKTIEDIRKEM